MMPYCHCDICTDRTETCERCEGTGRIPACRHKTPAECDLADCPDCGETLECPECHGVGWIARWKEQQHG